MASAPSKVAPQPANISATRTPAPAAAPPPVATSLQGNQAGLVATPLLPASGVIPPSAFNSHQQGSEGRAVNTNPGQSNAPTPLASAKSLEQDQDTQYGRYIYRCGELTWFNRGSAWCLSVITTDLATLLLTNMPPF
ncbi:hypothetical protein IMSHALPRED_007105 [Imshaugia aleurites]|uniref:Uncharacterized protein n=1 Tax=Imshaugia aleurites TaxID=172621 RepID=A0A8H3IGD5_9LECA|nr:hypothetical protein IMSHALPRED_007105 [Imshaugia aleurites]